MARRKKSESGPGEIYDLRHDSSSRVNIPPAGLAPRGEIVKEKQVKFAYNPHLAPIMRFDATGGADQINKLVEEAGKRKLNPDELDLLQQALRNYEPWLEWSGKREQPWCVADPVALNIHERISTQAVLKVAKRLDVQRDLFADPEQEYREAVQFYKHKMDWTNRMILGDSLSVMASLARREALAGKVQMIYMDPPYGIGFSKNIQETVAKPGKDNPNPVPVEQPEMVKAYRDTWTLGVHSYLSYLRDRLLICKELLADSGSIFVQIGDENLHTVRSLMTEVFGASNFIAMIAFKKKKMPLRETHLFTMCDYLLWFAKEPEKMKFRRLYMPRDATEGGDFKCIEVMDGRIISLDDEAPDYKKDDVRYQFQSMDMRSSGRTESCVFPFDFNGRQMNPSGDRSWKTNMEGMRRLYMANRLFAPSNSLRYKFCLEDYSVQELSHMWMDTQGATDKQYVVQTSDKVVARCLLMTTDPGDLVVDPTCGAGTTAYVAENWGRRWITIDVSRVALAIARQRLLTAKYDYCKLRPTSAEDVQRNPDGPWLTDPAGQIQGACTFDCKTVPHVTIKSIAQNPALDPIFDKYELILSEKLAALNEALKAVTKEIRQNLIFKLTAKQKAEGKKAITDADHRRWELPETEWKDWEVPFDTDPDWPKPLQDAVSEYRKAWRQKMDEVNACIAARADQEELVDQPFVDKSKIRVSGPFTMEGVIPAEESIDDGTETPIAGAPDALETFGEGEGSVQSEAQNAEAYLDRMIRLLRDDGVRFPDNKVMKFSVLEAQANGSDIHAHGSWGEGADERKVAVVIGPQYGAMNAHMVEDGIRLAAKRGYDDLVFAAFSFDGASQAAIQADPDPHLRIHMAQIRPDVNMGDLLKNTVSSQLFTVSGAPRTKLEKAEDGQFIVRMEGVDIYDPVTNSVRSTGAEKVAAWFLDSDYDGRCFCVCQAFFPDKSAWEKLGKALGGSIDEEAFAKFSGTVSLPFTAGEHNRVAVKVIDPRGNEVLSVHALGGAYG